MIPWTEFSAKGTILGSIKTTDLEVFYENGKPYLRYEGECDVNYQGVLRKARIIFYKMRIGTMGIEGKKDMY